MNRLLPSQVTQIILSAAPGTRRCCMWATFCSSRRGRYWTFMGCYLAWTDWYLIREQSWHAWDFSSMYTRRNTCRSECPPAAYLECSPALTVGCYNEPHQSPNGLNSLILCHHKYKTIYNWIYFNYTTYNSMATFRILNRTWEFVGQLIIKYAENIKCG